MQTDIAIVGGGHVGLTLACALAQSTSLSITVVEAKEEPSAWNNAGYHHRVSAISLSSQRIFKSLGVWAGIASRRISPFNCISVRDAKTPGQIQFHGHDIAEPILGYIVENNAIQTALIEKVKQYPQISYLTSVILTGFKADAAQATLQLSDDKSITCKLAVAADGANSWLRQQAGIQCPRQDYQQAAIVASVKTAIPHALTARQIFLNTGPLAFLPMQDEHWCSIVWTLPAATANEYMQLNEQDFRAKLADTFLHELGEIVEIDKRYSFPLGRQQAQHYIASRLALVGDAAHTVHPLAGQGVNMGLLDAASLTDIICETDLKRRDIGGVSALRRYERWRKGDHLLMYQGIDLIKQCFENHQPTFQRARHRGLAIVNQVNGLKNIFTRHAVGNRAGLPSFAQYLIQ